MFGIGQVTVAPRYFGQVTPAWPGFGTGQLRPAYRGFGAGPQMLGAMGPAFRRPYRGFGLGQADRNVGAGQRVNLTYQLPGNQTLPSGFHELFRSAGALAAAGLTVVEGPTVIEHSRFHLAVRTGQAMSLSSVDSAVRAAIREVWPAASVTLVTDGTGATGTAIPTWVYIAAGVGAVAVLGGIAYALTR